MDDYVSFEGFERLVGTGYIYNGSQKICSAQYSIETYFQKDEARILEEPSSIDLPKEIQGFVKPIEISFHSLFGQDLTLALEDGRALDFFLTETKIGTITAKAGFKTSCFSPKLSEAANSISWVDSHLSSQYERGKMSIRQTETPSGKTGLTMRESKIIAAVVAGESDYEIAEQNSLSVQTINDCLIRIFRKLGVYDRLELVLFAIYHGLAGKQSEQIGHRTGKKL